MGIELFSFLASYQVVSRKRFLQTTHNYLYIKKKDAISPTENCIITPICNKRKKRKSFDFLF